MSFVTRGLGRTGGPLATAGLGRVQRTFGPVINRFRDYVVRITTYLNREVIR